MYRRRIVNHLSVNIFGLFIIGVILAAWYLHTSAELFRAQQVAKPDSIRVGAAAIDIEADDNMVIGGSIFPGKARGQEGQLRAVAVVLEQPALGRLAIVACDVLMLTRDLLDPITEEISRKFDIPADRLLINATHTHHAPSTVTVHAYQREELFCRRVQRAIVDAVAQAVTRLQPADFYFALGQEATVGQNSRLLLQDGTIFWIGPRHDTVRPTGPFDSDLPVLAFRSKTGKGDWIAIIFNHSTHTIGTRQPGVRSPSFYGLAAQELETELGGVICFLQGASGSTHNLTVPTAEAVTRIKNAVSEALAEAQPRGVQRLRGVRKPFRFRVRQFDEAAEEQAVSNYCRRRVPDGAEGIIEAFRRQRKILAALQGQEKETWLQVLQIGDVAIAGVPAEFFTKLGLDVKRRSPFRYSYIAELANDWIGYLPDRKAFELGGYQTWTGLHSYAEPGTGERVVNEIVAMLERLQQD